MSIQLKPLHEQVMVIVGASSGIGLCTARRAARAGARVVLAARNERDLAAAVAEIHREGGRAAYVVADVADAADVDRIAETAISRFGGFDTWVNNAATSIYGRLDEIEMADKRRLFDVDFWGVVHGCRSALPHLRRHGGALVNTGSVTSDCPLPLLGIYSAAKHAVKAYTDALRMELEEEGAPVSVSLIKPGSIDTPFFEHAKSYLGVEPLPVPPVYAPEIVADAILACAVRPIRDVVVGGGGEMMSAMARHAPRITDKYLERTAFEQQRSDIPLGDRPDNLFAPLERDGGERGRNWKGRVHESSAYTAASLNPVVAAAALAGLGLAVIAGARMLRRGERAGDVEREVVLDVAVEPMTPMRAGTLPPHGDALPRARAPHLDVGQADALAHEPPHGPA
jgi:NAD(P)-dependent dehydrogenase (short-subunit alcohol dehydrogenase family)